jgi:hypothetical protein
MENIDSRRMTLIEAEKLDRMYTQIRAANSLIAQLRTLVAYFDRFTRTVMLKQLCDMLDRYQHVITQPKPTAPTTGQVRAVFEQTRKLYHEWASSLSADEFHMTYEAWIQHELSKLYRGVETCSGTA